MVLIENADTGEIKFFTESYYAWKFRAEENCTRDGHLIDYPWSAPETCTAYSL